MMEGQQQKTEDKRTDGKGRGRQNRRHRPMQEPKKKDPDGVPILRYGPITTLYAFRKHCPRKH
jgi:hypothetical protein